MSAEGRQRDADWTARMIRDNDRLRTALEWIDALDDPDRDWVDIGNEAISIARSALAGGPVGFHGHTPDERGGSA